MRNVPMLARLALVSSVAMSSAAAATPLPAGGAFTCDLLIDGTVSPFSVPEAIERDRQLLLATSAAAGFQHKIIPISLAADGVNLWAGGRYLFDTYAQAQAYAHMIKVDFVTEDGVQFLDRPMFLSNACYPWEVIGAEETAPVFRADGSTTRAALRTERWRVPAGDLRAFLANQWPAIRDAALARGLEAVWLLYNQGERLVQLVAFSDRVDPSWQNPPLFDFANADWATFATLAGMPPLGDSIAFNQAPGNGPWNKLLDRTDFTLNAWPLYEAGDQGPAAQWPNSGPFSGPFCGDGVCVPSQGEDHGNCPVECAANCGDAVCDADETQALCPGDCGL